MTYLYHLSPYKFDILKPKSIVQEDPEEKRLCSYAVSLEFLTIGFCFSKSVGFSSFVTGDEDVNYYEGQVSLPINDDYQGFIYAVDSRSFTPTNEHRYISFEDVEIEYCLPVRMNYFISYLEKDNNQLKIYFDSNKVKKLRNILVYLNEINDILNNPLFNNFKSQALNIINNLIQNYQRYNFTSHFHGIEHSLAVIRNILLIMQELEQTNNILELIFAGGYHDCGRSLDLNNKDHGFYSSLLSERFAPDYLNKELSKILMIFHDNENVAKNDETISILRDADILDLQRLNIQIDLNKTYYKDIIERILNSNNSNDLKK